MDEKERVQVLEQALAQMLKPVKGIPFSVIVKSLAERQVIQIDRADAADVELLDRLEKAIQFCAAELIAKPIRRPRPNEVGNDVEAYVMRALPQAGLAAARPTSSAGVASRLDTQTSWFAIVVAAPPTWNARCSRKGQPRRRCGRFTCRRRNHSRCPLMRATYSWHSAWRRARFQVRETRCMFRPLTSSSTFTTFSAM